MHKQTEGLVKSLPYCASLLKEADQHGRHYWQIVQTTVHFTEAKPEDWTPIPPFEYKGKSYLNSFDNRTDPLEISARLSKQWERKEKGRRSKEDVENYYGVWEMTEGDSVIWQTILPIQRNSY